MATTLVYDKVDNSNICTQSKTCNLPAGVVPYCYSNDPEYPNDNQICAYEQDGFLIPSIGCCDKVCPSEHCPSLKGKSAPPQKQLPLGISNPMMKKTNKPFPKLIKLVLISFGILLVLAGIFLSLEEEAIPTSILLRMRSILTRLKSVLGPAQVLNIGSLSDKNIPITK